MFHQYLDTESPGEVRGQPLHNLHPWLTSSLNQGELRALGLVVHYPLHAGEGGLHMLAVVLPTSLQSVLGGLCKQI